MKYRIEQRGDLFYPQYKGAFWGFNNFVNVDVFGQTDRYYLTLRDAQLFIDSIIENDQYLLKRKLEEDRINELRKNVTIHEYKREQDEV